jgi:hypothetical protein
LRVTWQDLRAVCLYVGCSDSRTKGDHLIMTRPGLARPVVIKMDRELGEDIIRSNMLTLGLTKKQFLEALAYVRRQAKKPRRKPRKR